MIGLVDYDLQSSTANHLHPPNLEIMKLASYYFLEKNHYCKLVNLNETELDGYDKIYFFSEQNQIPRIPSPFLKAENVLFGGTAFTNGQYIPFKDPIIDYSFPRVSIYQDFLKQQYDYGIKYQEINHFLEDSYYRMYAGDIKLPIPVIRQKRRLYIYDTNIFHLQWESIFNIILERTPASIICIHPIVCKQLSYYLAIRNITRFSRTNTIILDIDIPLTDVNAMFKKYKNIFLADIVIASNVYLPIGGSLKTQIEYYNDFIYKINLLYAFWSHGIPMKIKFIVNKDGYANPLCNTEKMIETLTSNMHRPANLFVTFEQRIPKKKKDNTLRDEYQKFLQEKPQVRKLFMQSFNDLKNKGVWCL